MGIYWRKGILNHEKKRQGNFKELRSSEPKAVMGLFDPPARACVKADLLSFSIPWPKFVTMLENMDDCFLNTYIWEKIQNRMKPTS